MTTPARTDPPASHELPPAMTRLAWWMRRVLPWPTYAALAYVLGAAPDSHLGMSSDLHQSIRHSVTPDWLHPENHSGVAAIAASVGSGLMMLVCFTVVTAVVWAVAAPVYSRAVKRSPRAAARP